MHRLSLAALALAALAGCRPKPFAVHATLDPSTTEPVRLPAIRVNGWFVVPVVLDGAEGRVLWMVYDTGMPLTSIDPDSLARVSDWSPGDATHVELDNVTIGPARIDDLSVEVLELDHISEGIGFPIDGILAYSVFNHTLVTLDYPAGEIRLQTGVLPKPNGEDIFPLSDDQRLRPAVEFSLAGREHELLLDSGGLTGINMVPAAAPALFGAPLVLTKMRYYGPVAEQVGRLDGDAVLFGRRFLSPVVAIAAPGYPSHVGVELLRHFVLTFDLVSRRVKVEGGAADWPEGEAPPIAPDAYRWSGVLTTPSADASVVRAVIEGTPGHELGIREGDRIVEINGVPWTERGYQGTRAQCDGDRRYYEYVIDRDGARHEFSVELVEILPVPAGMELAPPPQSLPPDLIGHADSPSEAELRTPDAAVPSPDGVHTARIVERDGHSIVRVFDGEHRIRANPVTRGHHRGLQWSADGRWLAFWRGEGDGESVSWSRWAAPADGSQCPEPVPKP